MDNELEQLKKYRDKLALTVKEYGGHSMADHIVQELSIVEDKIADLERKVLLVRKSAR